ncbi:MULTISPECIES: endonuclease domain-containing protein [Bacillus]|uniref:endonuclease domain-containing protein n=1 Tax=Bacillus TaxID=1386 RepID=UPI00207969BD|nr:DUF559 domain-containing protein [Bacillus mycoides]
MPKQHYRLNSVACNPLKWCSHFLKHYRNNFIISVHVQEKMGKYRLDFAIYGTNGKKLCIEVDGYTFHNTPEAKRKDVIRDAYLNKLGWEVLRISDRQLKKNLNMCMRKIEAKLYDMDLLPEGHPSMQLKLQTKNE